MIFISGAIIFFSSGDLLEFDEVRSLGLVSPAGRYSHQMVSQLGGEPLYSDYGVKLKNQAFGEDSLYVHGGMINLVYGTMQQDYYNIPLV